MLYWTFFILLTFSKCFALEIQYFQLGKFHIPALVNARGERAWNVDLANLFLQEELIKRISLHHGLIEFEGKLFISEWLIQAHSSLQLEIRNQQIIAIQGAQKNFKGIPVWATTFEPQTIASRGHHGNFQMLEGDLAAALPNRSYLGKNIMVFHPQTKKAVIVPVLDVGPWNTKDDWIKSGKRPEAETGLDRRGRKTNLAGLDLSSQVWIELGIPVKTARSYKYSAFVEFIILNGIKIQN